MNRTILVCLCVLGVPWFACGASPDPLGPKSLLLKYAVQDQHDTLSVQLQDAIGDLETLRMEMPRHRIQLERLEELSTSGSVSEASVLAQRWEVKLDELGEPGLARRVEGLRQKLAALEALTDGKAKPYLEADLASNQAQLGYFDTEVRKAEVTVAYWKDYYQRIHQLCLIGASPEATDRQTETTLRRSEIALQTWRNKQAEQAKQVKASAEALAEAKKRPAGP